MNIADTPTPKAQEGEWTLTAPDGRTWQCKNMLSDPDDKSMESERYECKVCGRTVKQYYSEMA